ncbi:MAG: hypothetical protein ACTSSH_13080 [Candidatus Heimdallarchaeota archaeon]
MNNNNEGSAKDNQKEMESYLGINSMDELFDDIPDSIRLKKPLKIAAFIRKRFINLL